MSKSLPFFVAFILACTSVAGQNIRDHYVSKADTDGVIYHTLPATLFENRREGDLTFDLTYKEGQQGRVTLNFTYRASRPVQADSVRFVAGDVVLAGPVAKFYIEPEKKLWKHRYSLQTDVALVRVFFDESVEPQAVVYSGGEALVYDAKRSAWRSYAPVGRKIFEMIRLNESR